MMRLAEFILSNTEAILAEWETFARTIWPCESGADVATLRDHASNILLAAARDMQAKQTDAQQSEKAQGEVRHTLQSDRLDDASVDHGVSRVVSGFDLRTLISEYRALRASVIRLWQASGDLPDLNDLDDLTRFNESIDQSLTRAVHAFTERIDHSRETFLAILGHDLRNPLSALGMASFSLRRDKGLSSSSVEMVDVIDNCVRNMNAMVGDLLDFARSALGDVIPIQAVPADLKEICESVAAEMRAANPSCALHLRTEGDVTGAWDAARLRQVVANLVGNAIQHGDSGRVDVAVVEDRPDSCLLTVHNGGKTISPDILPTIFDPFVRDVAPDAKLRRRPGSMGLGLYIARAIALAHGGALDVVSAPVDGTTFTLCLPRATVTRA